MQFHSQFSEDRWIVEHLALPTKGYYVDVGAYDGFASSNTLCFEAMGWDGVLFEPLYDKALACKDFRRGKTIHSAVGSYNCLRPFHLHPTDPGQSGFLAVGEPEMVPCVTLTAALNSLKVQQINLMSIDTEGTELEVWRGRGIFNPDILIIEYLQWGKPPNDKEIVGQLTEDGYSLVHRTEANLIFTR